MLPPSEMEEQPLQEPRPQRRRKEPLQGVGARGGSSHAWQRFPVAYLSAVGHASPQPVAAAALSLALEALARDLKEVSKDLLRLLELPENTTAAREASIRAAIHHCAEVHKSEVLPKVRFFLANGGGASQDWAAVLRRLARGVPGRPTSAGTATARAVNHAAKLWGPVPQDVESLESEVEKAVLRSLQVAAVAGVAEAKAMAHRLAARFCAVDRLLKKSTKVQAEASHLVLESRPASARTRRPPVDAWTDAPWRQASTPQGTEAGDEPWAKQTGPILCGAKDAEIRALLGVAPPPGKPKKARPRSAGTCAKRPLHFRNALPAAGVPGRRGA